ncbi:response regulator [bacterium]|nr:response regulator [bacterium]
MSNKGRILIADDDEGCRKFVSEVLRQEGYECECAGDGTSAGEALKKESFDVLVCDINMPGNRELELIRDLPPPAAGMPVILVTGYPTLETAISSVNLSVMAYIVKPVRRQELLDHVSKLAEYSKVCKSGREVRDRLNGWTREMMGLQEYLVKSPRLKQPLQVGDFVSLTLGNMLGSILDLKSLTEGLGQEQDAREVCRLYDCPPLRQYRELIQETIKVLEKTKSSFKSRELCELRQKLEQFTARNP